MIKRLNRTLPHKAGVEARALLDIFNAFDDPNLGVHSLMVIRHDKIVAEGWWKPYSSEKRHTLFSLSKTFTGLAVGFAIQDGLLSINDKIVSFFKRRLPSKPCVNMSKMTIKDLLTMSPGFAADPHYFNRRREDDVINDSPYSYHNYIYNDEPDWIKNFLYEYVPYEPGTKFLYCTHGTYLLSVIVQEITGKTIFDYLKCKLFVPLGINDINWQRCPHGYNVGGWGLNMGTEDIAKLGLFLLNKGLWEGEQLINQEWVLESSSCQIAINYPDDKFNEGYGYQIWIGKEEGNYYGEGAFGQLCFVIPDRDAVVIVTAGSNKVDVLKRHIWDILVPGMHDEVEEDKESQEQLERKMSSLTIKTPLGIQSNKSDFAHKFSGIRYELARNLLGLTSIKFDFDKYNGNKDKVTIGVEGREFTTGIGYNQWVDGETCVKTEDTDTDTTIIFESISCAGAWKNGIYELIMCFDETAYINTMKIKFDDWGIIIEHSRNCSFMRSTNTTMIGRPTL